jgi:hypothetical protein
MAEPDPNHRWRISSDTNRMLGQLPKRPSGAGYEQSCLHFEVKHRTQTWDVAYRSFAGRASAGMFVYAESVIVRFWRSQKVTASGTPRFRPSKRPSRTDLTRFRVVQEKT